MRRDISLRRTAIHPTVAAFLPQWDESFGAKKEGVMAAVLVLATGFFGFLAAVAGWTILGLGFLSGLALWSGSGLLGLALALAFVHLHPAEEPPAMPHPQAV